MNQDHENRRESNKRLCRSKILTASRQLFSSKGYEETTMDEVAKRAEVSRATLYNYFPSKERLLVGIAEAELTDLHRLIDVDLKSEPRCLLKLRRVLELYVYDTISYLALCRKITYLNVCPESAMYEAREEMRAIFRELVLGAQAQGDLREDVPADNIVHIVMSINLMAQFEWSNMSQLTERYCMERLRWYFDTMLAGVRT